MPDPKTPRSIPHRRTRESHASETAEDYVEAVFEIIEDLGTAESVISQNGLVSVMLPSRGSSNV